MSPGRKAKTKEPSVPLPGKIPGKSVGGTKAASAKSTQPETTTGFAPGNYYRQGVLVPGGPHKSALPRTRNR